MQVRLVRYYVGNVEQVEVKRYIEDDSTTTNRD